MSVSTPFLRVSVSEAFLLVLVVVPDWMDSGGLNGSKLLAKKLNREENY